MKADHSLLEKFGNTPLVPIRNIGRDYPNVPIFAKAEWFNPSGSVKDRAASRIVMDAINSGRLKPGSVLLDSSSGNTGISYAMLGAMLDFRVRLVLPANVSPERKAILQAYGCEVVISDALEGSEGSRRLAKKLSAEDPSLVFVDQYENNYNVLAHYEGTGPEIWEQTEHKVTHFIAGAGTGGTITGVSKFLKEVNPDIRTYSVQPDDEMHGLEGLKHMETAHIPGIYDESSFDDILEVDTERAYEMVRRLGREEGYFVGFSSGAAMVAALDLAATLKEGVIVTIFCDTGAKYLSSHVWD
jgi:S-sulfo-L-cysteine synthase (O-acetyl-L-serine-dependent)